MDHLNTYEEAVVFKKNPPSLAPRPDFARIRALRKHIVTAHKLIVCPQSAIHGWGGLVMDPVMYALLKPTAPLFIGVNNPGNFPVYANFAPEAAIKMTDKQFKRDKNYFLSFVNINWAHFFMLDSTIADQFRVSNTPTMTGWNSSMSICSIIEQFET
jgi:hypothetical protein